MKKTHTRRKASRRSRWSSKELDKTARAIQRKRRTSRTRAARSSPAPVLRTVLLGAPVELVYRHARGGTYRHKFSRGSRVTVTPDGRVLVIDGVSVKQFIEG